MPVCTRLSTTATHPGLRREPIPPRSELGEEGSNPLAPTVRRVFVSKYKQFHTDSFFGYRPVTTTGANPRSIAPRKSVPVAWT
jgi:hypothetical protein